MPRPRKRVALESGPVVDLKKIIRKATGRPGMRVRSIWTFSSGSVLRIEVRLGERFGSLTLTFDGDEQHLSLTSQPRRFGGRQWYVICPRTRRNVRVLFRPLGATSFASRHAWGRQVAYASQFLDVTGRAWRKQAKIKARLIGHHNPDEWDLPPKPKRMRLRTYERWEARYDRAEEIKDEQLCIAAARFMKWL